MKKKREVLIDCIAMAMESWGKDSQGIPATQLADTFVEVVESWPGDTADEMSKLLIQTQRMLGEAIARLGEADIAAQQRDRLVVELADLFDWTDSSYAHAVMHVRNAVLNLRTNLMVAQRQCEAYMKHGLALNEKGELLEEDEEEATFEEAELALLRRWEQAVNEQTDDGYWQAQLRRLREDKILPREVLVMTSEAQPERGEHV